MYVTLIVPDPDSHLFENSWSLAIVSMTPFSPSSRLFKYRDSIVDFRLSHLGSASSRTGILSTRLDQKPQREIAVAA